MQAVLFGRPWSQTRVAGLLQAARLLSTAAGDAHIDAFKQLYDSDIKSVLQGRDGAGRTGPPSPSHSPSHSAAHSSQPAPPAGPAAPVIKELLRLFSRPLPGGLVPDDLVTGFMRAHAALSSPEERLAFYRTVIRDMGLSVPEVQAAVALWEAAAARAAPSSLSPSTSSSPTPAAAAATQPTPSPELLHRAADRLAAAASPLYTQLFAPLSQAEGGILFLVRMRGELLELAAGRAAAGAAAEAAPLRAMAEHLRRCLAEWFSVGMLRMERVTWGGSPAALLERVMSGEAVHPMAGGWGELRRRLGPARRVFAFMHPSLPGEPLVVLHTALMERPAASMAEILGHRIGDSNAAADGAAAGPANTATAAAVAAGEGSPAPRAAVFYSISATQPGLKGVELGHFLIKRVAERLMSEHPSLRHLVTLSPLPGFRAWLTARLRQEAASAAAHAAAAAAPAPAQHGEQPPLQPPQPPQPPLLLPAEAEAVLRLAGELGWRGEAEGGGGAGAAASIASPAAAAPSAASPAAALLWLLEGDRWLAGEGHHPAASLQPYSTPTEGDDGEGGGSGVSTPAAAAASPAHPLAPCLLRLAARYLLAERRRRCALCPVGHFHLRNGAMLWRLNWGADPSPLGLSRSLGIMVNYRYDLPALYDNNRNYLLHHEIRAHAGVSALLRRGAGDA